MHKKNQSIQHLLENLQLLPHPGGGFYKEVYRSQGMIPKIALSEKFSGDRSYCTSIYSLLTSEDFFAFHKVQQDEIYHFYGGSPLSVHIINKEGNYTKHKLGIDVQNGEQPQLVISAEYWFASNVEAENSYTLIGCTVAPGFHIDDFELADRKILSNEYPKLKDIIHRFTKN